MIGQEKHCEDLHHKCYFLLDVSKIENSELHVRLIEGIDQPVNPFPKEGVFVEGNTKNIYTTIPTNISLKLDVMKNFHIGANYSPK